jgi:sulfoxide reductase catalytic subunit YedY
VLIKRPVGVPSSAITPRDTYLRYLRRREFVKTCVGGLATGFACAFTTPSLAPSAAPDRRKLPDVVKGPFGNDEPQTPYEAVTTYNNFYEFGSDKESPAKLAKSFRTEPWTIVVEGEVERKGTFHLDDFIKPHTLEERIYRMRCVEGWSMVIPWVGFPLGDVITGFGPTSRARFVEFRTLLDIRQMPGEVDPVLRWPYTEGLRLDEAMHPLTILAVGVYGEVLPNQNGAPLRLIVPWKYGFKGIKSIVRMRFVEKQPLNTWQIQSPSEYGFYANVNPQVDHPRWSQATERRIGEFLKRKTLMFNGYADQVASLYAGMDLRKNF